jgi:hypothetical protein
MVRARAAFARATTVFSAKRIWAGCNIVYLAGNFDALFACKRADFAARSNLIGSDDSLWLGY